MTMMTTTMTTMTTTEPGSAVASPYGALVELWAGR